jgi:hypothetical protein
MYLGSTQPVVNILSGVFLGVKAAGAVVKKSGSLNFLEPSGPARPVLGELYLYLYLKYT